MKYLIVTACAGIALAATPVAAQDRAGDFQIKVMATGVLTDGEIEQVNVDLVGLPAGTNTTSNDNHIPTIAVEYFVTDKLSIETIAGTTQHDVDAIAGLPPGAELVSDALLLPATVTAKLHFDLLGTKPYVGAGPAYFIWLSDKPGAAVVPLGVTDTDLSDELGIALQAGIDVPVGKAGFGLTLDAKRYFISTTATWSAAGTVVIQTEHNLNPWVLSAGVSYRF
ncbi:OmpW/AlkL family protein [Qipengyuania sp. ASV99]|uniref:OmpW/AlkL family protein n=1 Tax=Qipengyuania sp. ASV99 TaxID=3399681 RepID=UPI003A4C5F49